MALNVPRGKGNCGAVSPKKTDSAEQLLKDSTGTVAKLRNMGITEFAIITYVVRVQDGQPREEALRGLLLGRSLTAEQELFVRTVLDRIPMP